MDERKYERLIHDTSLGDKTAARKLYAEAGRIDDWRSAELAVKVLGRKKVSYKDSSTCTASITNVSERRIEVCGVSVLPGETCMFSGVLSQFTFDSALQRLLAEGRITLSVMY